jgi:hypothetical protein
VKAIAFALVLLIATTAVAPDVPPPVRRKPDLRYVASGAVLFGFFHVLALALAIRYEEGELAVPVLGPLIDLRRCRECTANTVEQGVVAGLVLDAVFQAAGASLFIVAMVRRKPVRVSVAPTPNGILVGGRF